MPKFSRGWKAKARRLPKPPVSRARAALAAGMCLMLPLAAAGCSGGAQPSETRMPLRIAIYDKGNYDHHLRDYIEAAFPDLEVEIIPTAYSAQDYSLTKSREFLKKLLDEKHPDLIYTYGDDYRYLASEGYLTDLTDYMRKDGVKESDYHPGAVEILKDNPNGRLYGLPEELSAEVLCYNKDLFGKYGVDPPSDGMAWSDIIRLASRFVSAGSVKAGIVGYYSFGASDLASYASLMAWTEGVQSLSSDGRTARFDTPAWKSIYSSILEGYRQGAFGTKDMKGRTEGGVVYFDEEAVRGADLFNQGKAAMTLTGIAECKSSAFEAGAAVAPVNSADPGRTASFRVGNIFAIPASAENKTGAWEVVKFMTGDYMAKLLSGTDRISARKSFLTMSTDPLAGKLFRMLPVKQPLIKDSIPASVHKELADMTSREQMKLVAGSQTLDETLAAMQTEGQAILDRYWNSAPTR